jgi:AcrR family transcriptional regulator
MKPRGRGGAADPGATRTALLEAGTQVFAERGFKGATADLIARRARANKAMINYHFGSKRGLYQAILTATFTEMASRLRAVRSAERPAPEQLRQFVAFFADLAASHPSFPVMLLREVISGGEHVGREEVSRLLGIVGLVREILEQGQREGTLRKVDPLLTHVSLVGSLCFFFATEGFRRRIFAEGRPPFSMPRAEDFVAHMQELITRGLAPERRARRTR